MGIWRSWLAWAPLDSPAGSRQDTPGKRAEGPGSPKGGKMKEEWPENEGWTTGSEWAGQGQRLDSPISVLLTLGTNGWSRLINDYKWWVIRLPKSSPLLPFWSSPSPQYNKWLFTIIPWKILTIDFSMSETAISLSSCVNERMSRLFPS